jgi:excisionase family DNA binding protein
MSNESQSPVVAPAALSPLHLAIRWGCSRQHIYNLIKRGDLKAWKTGRHDRITLTEIERIERGDS